MNLGEIKGLLPEKKITHTPTHIASDVDERYGYNQAIDDTSTLKALDVVKAIFKSGAVRIDICKCLRKRYTDSHSTNIDCPTCDGQGFVITDNP